MFNLNVPDHCELFTIPLGKRKVASVSYGSNSTTFTIEREDHTVGNLLQNQLLSFPDVTFAGYKMPHPLDHHFVLSVQTVTHTPTQAMLHSIRQLLEDLHTLKHKFCMEAIQYKCNEMDNE